MKWLRRAITAGVFVLAWGVCAWGVGQTLWQGVCGHWSFLVPDRLGQEPAQLWRRQEQLVQLLRAGTWEQFSQQQKQQALHLAQRLLHSVPLNAYHWQQCTPEEKQQAAENLTMLLVRWLVDQARRASRLESAEDQDQLVAQTVERISRWWLPSLLALTEGQGAPRSAGFSPPMASQTFRRIRQRFSQELKQLSLTEKLVAGGFMLRVGRELQRRWTKELAPRVRMPGED